MTAEKNCGYILENELFEKLKALPAKKIYTEKQLTELYGWDASSVDFMIEFSNYTLFIQTKFLNTRRRENHHINNFIKSLNHIKKEHNVSSLHGIWVCRIDPFDDNIRYLNMNKTDVVSCFESINDLVDKTMNHIISIC
jgi:hypothetical protein